MVPIAPRLREPLRSALRGEAAPWPDVLSDEELESLVIHGVAPLVYAAAHVPQLRAEAIRAAVLEELRAEDSREVLTALEAEGLRPLVLKGTALAYGLYAQPHLRPRGDTDLLIAEDELDRARRIFLSLGFAEQPASRDEHGLRQTVFLRAGGASVMHAWDVHWGVANTPLFSSALRYEDLLRRAAPLPRLSPAAYGLDDVDALLLACIHRVAHHHDSDRVIWIVDVALLRERMTRAQHERFWRAAAEARIVGACVRSVALADEWLGRAPRNRAEEWLTREELERDEPSRAFLDRDITRGGILLANLRALPWSARLQRLWHVAFPPASFMRSSFGARSALALPWLYAYRAGRGVLRLFRRVGR